MQSSAAIQLSCILMAKETVSCFPMNKAEEKEKDAEEEEVEGEIITTMQSSVTMQQSCTRRPRQFLFQ